MYQDTPPIQEVDQEETLSQYAMWLEERVTALEKEKDAMEMSLKKCV